MGDGVLDEQHGMDRTVCVEYFFHSSQLYHINVPLIIPFGGVVKGLLMEAEGCRSERKRNNPYEMLMRWDPKTSDWDK